MREDNDITAALVLHRIADSPSVSGCNNFAASCVVCARRRDRTADYAKWQSPAFTDQSKLRGQGLSTRICEPCAYVHSWVSPTGYVQSAEAKERKHEAKRKAGQEIDEENEKLPSIRLFWHAWDEGEYLFGNKADKAVLREWLFKPRNGRWFCSVPDSGKKHLIPWTPINMSPPSRLVQLEERELWLGEMSLVEEMTDALTAGVTKAEIETGRYTLRSVEIAGPYVRLLRSRAQTQGGGAWWALAVYLAQRDEEQVSSRLVREGSARESKKEKVSVGRNAEGRRSEGRNSRDDQGGESGVSVERRGPADALESAAVERREVVQNEKPDREMAVSVQEEPTPPVGQLALF